MSEAEKKARAMSVRQRLLNKSRETGFSFDLLAQRYAIERLLFRLQYSPYEKHFILKGAMVFLTWGIDLPRPTRDLDLMGFVQPEPAALIDIFREILLIKVEEDGLDFLSDSVTAEQIKEEDSYAGIRVTLLSKLGAMKINLQIDIGTGDSLLPEPFQTTFPALLGDESPHLRAYRRELVVAEKYEAIVKLGEKNSRMKDFFDIWFLARTFTFQKADLCQALEHTFKRRGTVLLGDIPLPLTKSFTQSPAKRQQWKAFLAKSNLTTRAPNLDEAAELIWRFLRIYVEKEHDSNSVWNPEGRNWEQAVI